MLKYLALLSGYAEFTGPLRMFDSIAFRSALALVAAFIVVLVTGRAFIRALAGLRVLEDVDKPDSVLLQTLHSKKRHTPTMGGVMIVFAILVTVFLFADPFNRYVEMALFATLGFAGIGLVDDYVKLRRIGRHQGLSRAAKLVAQFLVAGLLAMALSQAGDRDWLTRLVIPGMKTEQAPELGLAYYAFFILVLVGASNAVNLSDGLDGLATGLIALVTLTYLVMAYAVGHSVICDYLRIPHVSFSGELTVFCGALMGSALGFLWFNAHPARVFMGDTGSLALGAAIGFVALAIKQELVLLIAGGIFVLEAISVILQVGSVKLTGRRLFRCAPFHHHLEFSGWSENHVVVRLWCLGIMLAALGLATLKMH